MINMRSNEVNKTIDYTFYINISKNINGGELIAELKKTRRRNKYQFIFR